MRSQSGVMLTPGPEIPLDSPTDAGAGWDVMEPKEVSATGLVEKARRAYPDSSIDVNSIFINTDSRAMIRFFPYPSVGFYLISPPADEQLNTPLSYLGILAVRGEEVYRLPEQFNFLLEDGGIQVTDANRADVARAFIWATQRELVVGGTYLSEPQVIDEADPRFPAYHYQLEVQSWAKERGVRVDWKLGFQDGRVAVARATVLGRFTGEWKSRLPPCVIDPFYEEKEKYYVCCDEEGSIR